MENEKEKAECKAKRIAIAVAVGTAVLVAVKCIAKKLGELPRTTRLTAESHEASCRELHG